MRTTCPRCDVRFEEETHWTMCPHAPRPKPITAQLPQGAERFYAEVPDRGGESTHKERSEGCYITPAREAAE